jgi:hypothetical protein
MEVTTEEVVTEEDEEIDLSDVLNALEDELDTSNEALNKIE